MNISRSIINTLIFYKLSIIGLSAAINSVIFCIGNFVASVYSLLSSKEVDR